MNLEDTLNKLCKWRSVFAGWQLGTRIKGDAECDAVRDHREVTILLRAEVNALTGLLLKKKLFTETEWIEALKAEAELLDKDYERKFPGITTSLLGTIYSKEAQETVKNWRP